MKNQEKFAVRAYLIQANYLTFNKIMLEFNLNLRVSRYALRVTIKSRCRPELSLPEQHSPANH